MKRRFLVELETDGMDYPRDMAKICKALKKAVPDIVRPFVHETAPLTVTFLSLHREIS